MKIDKVRKLNEGLMVDQAINQYTAKGISEEEIVDVIKSEPLTEGRNKRQHKPNKKQYKIQPEERTFI